MRLSFGQNLGQGTKGGLEVLCLGAHSDDIEIGCGGTILRLAAEHPDIVFHWVVLSASDIRRREACKAAQLFAGASALRGPIFKSFRDGFMPYMGAEVKDFFEELKKSISPDLIFTHYRNDAHQDHRLISELTWNTYRNHMVLEYEIPKFDGDLGQPGVFVTLDKEVCQRKAGYLMEAFESQRSKQWFDEDTFLGLMRLRGMECVSPSGYAEAFYSRKVVL
jgi:LmbE family N-acetylglucosaminyl deacetylase